MKRFIHYAGCAFALAFTPLIAVGAGLAMFGLTFYTYPKGIIHGAKRNKKPEAQRC